MRDSTMRKFILKSRPAVFGAGFMILLIAPKLTCAQVNDELVRSFAETFAKKHNTTAAEVMEILNTAEYQESIIKKMNRPAEKMPWYRYRSIFLTEERIKAGKDFWVENRTTLEKVSTDTGIPVEIILGIIGVETFFGKIKGDYLVLDALYTLSFAYPRRAKYFQSELEHFLILSKEENIDPYTVKGSYAGAMGYCQFMPSSYRAYAKNFDDAGGKNLIDSPEDAIASVANYLKVHRWKKDQPIVAKVQKSQDVKAIGKQSLKPKYKPSYYEEFGYSSAGLPDASALVILVRLEQKDGMEYWFGMHNFYVITRYNHSALYAMAVYQLAEAILEKGM